MSPPDDSAHRLLEPPDSGVTVRLYNPGFGDCLLLAFRGEDGRARYMLIDCGVHHQYSGGDERIGLVAEDIAAATDNHLHVVAITHEHTDHLYGFRHARDTFEGMEIDDLWLAWTEDEDDPVAQALKRRYGKRMKALGAAVDLLEQAGHPLGKILGSVWAFECPGALAAAGGNAAQLAFLREQSANPPQRPEDYRRPEEAPLTVPGVKGVRVYVLGPPKDVASIASLERKSELYPKLAALDAVSAFAAAALDAEGADSLDDEDRDLARRSRPFDDAFGIAADQAADHPAYGAFFRRCYGFADEKGHGPAWRRVDTDWLGAAEQLALAINSKINNTSLVLAIELTETDPRKVLLFTGDAQTGNWLSWHALSWPAQGDGEDPVTTADLLQRTALYKVGHHGSHNATLSHKGLEMMTSPDLVAMIPVDEEWARTKQHWKHPAEKLLKRLKEQARGRVIRADEIPQGDEPPQQPDESIDSEWSAFVAHLDWDRGPDRLWIQYTVPG